MRRILYITAFPPNECTGGQAFSKNAIHDLAQSDRLDVWYFAYPGHKPDLMPDPSVENVRSWNVPRSAWLGYPTVHPIFSRRMGREFLLELRRVAAGYDLLYFDLSQVAMASLMVDHPCKVVRLHDVLCQKFDRKAGWTGRWVRRTESRIVRSAAKVLVPSEKDAALLRDNYGVEADYTHEYIKPFDPSGAGPVTERIVFYGYWKRPENADGLRWFIRKVMPLLQVPREFAAVGGGMPEDLKRLAGQIGVRCLGFVEDPMPELYRSAALVVPLFQGAGVKVKALDAFATGTRVIGTPLAFEGLPEFPELETVCDSPASFAAAVDALKPSSASGKLQRREAFLAQYDNRHLSQRLAEL
ncbi:MAG: glycosyltransferase [Paludibacteraceae bacterium]|nr:glycosyltransferase [Paludibacteraceae bacterium]